MSRYILAIDQGTTGSTVLVLNESLEVLGRHTEEFPQIYPQPGWVEHDPNAILTSVQNALAGALEASGIDPNQIAGIGITNQRETTVVWDRETSEPIYNAIVWQCRRTADWVQGVRDEDFIHDWENEADIREDRTGARCLFLSNQD